MSKQKTGTTKAGAKAEADKAATKVDKATAIDHATLDAIAERMKAGETIMLAEFRAYRDGGGAASYHVLRGALIERIGMAAFAELVPQRGGGAKAAKKPKAAKSTKSAKAGKSTKSTKKSTAKKAAAKKGGDA